MEFGCSICDYISPLKVNVQKHIIKLNKCGENPEVIEIPTEIKCEQCSKLFTTRPNLRKHSKICKEIKKQLIKEEIENKLSITKIDNFMYILQEREFVNSKQNIYKIGVTKDFSSRVSSYPKGSKVFCVKPVEGDPETDCLQKFRNLFISRVDIGSEYFEGDINLMINTMYKCTI